MIGQFRDRFVFDHISLYGTVNSKVCFGPKQWQKNTAKLLVYVVLDYVLKRVFLKLLYSVSHDFEVAPV